MSGFAHLEGKFKKGFQPLCLVFEPRAVCVSGLGEVPSFKALEVSLPLQACGLCSGDLPGPSKGLRLSEAKGIKLQRLLLLSSSAGAGCQPRGLEVCLSPGLILPLPVYPRSQEVRGNEGVPRLHFTGTSRALVQRGLLFA